MDERVFTDSVLLKKPSKKTVKIEFYPAGQWKGVFPYGDKKMWPKPLNDPQWWDDRFRLKVDGKWHKENGHKYSFYIRDEAFLLISSFAR